MRVYGKSQLSDVRSLDRFGILVGGGGGGPERSQRGASLAARPSSATDADALRAGLGLVGALGAPRERTRGQHEAVVAGITRGEDQAHAAHAQVFLLGRVRVVRVGALG